jgi:uncharacterized protein YqgC (DUF456 family)
MGVLHHADLVRLDERTGWRCPTDPAKMSRVMDGAPDAIAQGLELAWIAWPVASVFTLLGLGCIVLMLLGLPGTWIMIGLAVLIDLVDGWWLADEARPTFSILVLAISVVLATLGEVLEFIASALGAQRAGASRRGIFGALAGSLVGAIAGTFLLPIPVVGTLAGAVVGSFGGAVLGEVSAGRAIEQTMKPATGAAIGRVLGTLGKLPFSVAVWAILSVAAFLG